jgi:hypothetical protein
MRDPQGPDKPAFHLQRPQQYPRPRAGKPGARPRHDDSPLGLAALLHAAQHTRESAAGPRARNRTPTTSARSPAARGASAPIPSTWTPATRGAASAYDVAALLVENAIKHGIAPRPGGRRYSPQAQLDAEPGSRCSSRCATPAATSPIPLIPHRHRPAQRPRTAAAAVWPRRQPAPEQRCRPGRHRAGRAAPAQHQPHNGTSPGARSDYCF